MASSEMAHTESPRATRYLQKRDLSADLTVFVLTVGDEPNLRDCLAHLDCQTVTFQTVFIQKVAPFSVAAQQMLDKCQTRFFVQVDEDMILYEAAIETLFDGIANSTDRTVLVCGGLWDCHMRSPVHGVKIYRHSIARMFPFENNASSDWTQFMRMKAAGYVEEMLPLLDRAVCLGEHGKHYTAESIFRRWRGLMHKHRRYGNMPWVIPWPERFLTRFLNTRDPLDLYAFAGAVAGIVGDLPEDREVDFRERCGDYQRLIRYLDAIRDSKYVNDRSQ